MTVQWIDNQQKLQAFCQQTEHVLALDTEFVRSRTFFPKPGLFQANNGQTIALIDPLAIDDWQALIALLLDEAVVKVLHACDEDMELLYYFLHIKPRNVFDTQVAAALCGLAYSLSYQNIVERLLGQSVEKQQQLSNWLARPLSEKQKDYAANDVRYLLPLYQQLKQQLAQQGKEALLAAHYQELVDELGSEDYSSAVWKINGTGRLSAKHYQRLQSLAVWRERLMREKDLPRKQIANDKALLTLAQMNVVDKYQLFAIEGLPSAIIKAEADKLIALLKSLDQQEPPSLPNRKRRDRNYCQLKDILQELAEQQHICVELLDKKLFTEQASYAVRRNNPVLPDTIYGWRRPFYQKALERMQHEMQYHE